MFRKSFPVKGSVKKARLYISGLGYYLSYINGKRIGDHELDTGWTDYVDRVYYSTYDVTELIQNGDNCLGVMVGNGWYNPLPLKMWGGKNIREALFYRKTRVYLSAGNRKLRWNQTDHCKRSGLEGSRWTGNPK